MAAHQAPLSLGFHFLLQCMKVKSLSCVWLLATPWTAAHQAPPSMGFSKQEYWSGVALLSPKSLHTYTESKLHPRANKFQSKTYQANSATKQEYNPQHKNTGSQKSHQTHRHLKTHYWTLNCTPERRDLAPPTRTPMQASLTRKPWQATHPTPPTGSKLHNKEEPQTARIQKGHTKHSNLNKMKRQRNTQQVKEHDKCLQNQTKEKEIGSLPEKQLEIMIVKIIQNLENKME